MTDAVTTTPKAIALSSDGRTNRWRIVCPACSHVFEPITTMGRYQGLNCPKQACNAGMVADYNAQPPIVKLAEILDTNRKIRHDPCTP